MEDLIKYRERNRQVIDFKNLQYGTLIHPTDIDGLIEYKDTAVIFFEMKYGNAEMPIGQRVAFERLCNDLWVIGKLAVCIECEHDVADCEKSVDAGVCRVRRYFYRGKWIEINKTRTVKEVVDNILAEAERKRGRNG